jgi:hypothetical protein
MADQMFSKPGAPFKYLLTYKFSQDHIELLFSCIRSKGGWNNNPNCLQIKYALRQLLMRNSVTASKNANCIDFEENKTTIIIPILHKIKHRSPLIEMFTQDQNADTPDALNSQETAEENFMYEQLHQNSHSDFISNILFYIGGYIVSTLEKKLTCQACKECLVGEVIPVMKASDPNYCGPSNYSQLSSASAFTLFVNNGGLRIPSKSVYTTIEHCEHIFKLYVCQKGNSINNMKNLKTKMILEVCHHFLLDGNKSVFADHELGANEDMVEDDHQVKLIKWTACRQIFYIASLHVREALQRDNPTEWNAH